MTKMKNKTQKLHTKASIWALVICTLFMHSCTCMTQIPTQYYFATDSCAFYLPDYSQAIEVRDNCCVDSTSFTQTPNSGTLLTPGTDVVVTLTARDCYGNTSTMQFDVVVIDKVPPSFYYDTTDFAPLGMYQNDVRTWHFWTDSGPDTVNNCARLYYSQEASARDRTTGIGTEIHDAYFQGEHYYKKSLFMPKSTYRATKLYMALAKVGNPQGKLHVEVWQMNMDTTLLQPICEAAVDLNAIQQSIAENPGNVQASELVYHTINLSDGFLVRGGWYCIRAHCTGVDADNKVIWNTSNYDTQDPYQFLMYSYDDEVSYGINPNANYMYQFWGIDL